MVGLDVLEEPLVGHPIIAPCCPSKLDSPSPHVQNDILAVLDDLPTRNDVPAVLPGPLTSPLLLR